MAGSVGGALAEGIERGMGLGFQIQDRERQAAQDKRRQEDADRQFGLDQQRYDQQMAADDRATQAERRKLLDDEHAELVSTVQGMLQAGQQVPPELAQRISANAASRREYRDKVLRPALAAERQQHLDTFARIQSGEIDPATLPGADLYRGLSLATGRTPEQIMDSVQGAQQVQQGFEAKNQGMLLEGVNKLFAPDLRAGVGSESPYGGEIVRKEIVHLLPAKDANGQLHPDKVMPVVRVYVRRQDAVGPAMEGGAIGYYDAPLTENRSTDPNDTVKVVDLANAFDYMGKLGSLAAVLQNPVMQAKLAEGAKEVGEQTKADVDAITALGYARLKPEDRMLMPLTEEQRAQAAQVKAGLAPKAKEDPAGLQRMNASLAEVDKALAEGRISPEQAENERTAIRTGARSGSGLAAITGKPAPKLFAGAKGITGKGGSAPAGAPGTAKLTGEPFLATLSPAEAAHVRAIVQGRADLKNLSGYKGGQREKYLMWARQYDPEFSEADYATGKATERAFTSGVEGRKIRSFNVALEHLDTLQKAADALKNGRVKAFNEIAQRVSRQFGVDAPVTFDGIKQVVATEVMAAIVQGAGTGAERREMSDKFDRANSPEQFLGMSGGLRELMGGQLKGLYQQYRSGGGQQDFRNFMTDAGTRASVAVGADLGPATGRGVNARAGGLPTTGPAGRATKAAVVSDDDNALINKYLRK